MFGSLIYSLYLCNVKLKIKQYNMNKKDILKEKFGKREGTD